jgi:hsp70-interacting protein
MDKLRMPSDAELMKIAIADLVNSTTSTDERQRALDELLILVEPIDNANGELGLSLTYFIKRCTCHT